MSLPIQVRYSRRARRITIRVLPERVTVTVPSGTPEIVTGSVIADKEPWIRSKLASFHCDDACISPAEFTDGTAFHLFGREVVLKLVPGPFSFEVQGDRVLAGEKGFTQRRARTWLDGLLMNKVEGYAKKFGAALGKTPSRVRLGNASTRWGSCSPSGSVMINRKLVHAPLFVVEYVVAHEVTHLLHRNHSPFFWRELEGLGVSVFEAKSWLRTSGMWLLTQREAR